MALDNKTPLENKIHVKWDGRLYPDVDNGDLRKFFVLYGEIVDFERRNNHKKGPVPFCTITFASADAAASALDSPDQQLDDGTWVQVNEEKDATIIKATAEKRKREEEIEREVERKKQLKVEESLADVKRKKQKLLTDPSGPSADDGNVIYVTWEPEDSKNLKTEKMKEHFSQFGTITGLTRPSHDPETSFIPPFCSIGFLLDVESAAALLEPEQTISDESDAKAKSHVKVKVQVEEPAVDEKQQWKHLMEEERKEREQEIAERRREVMAMKRPLGPMLPMPPMPPMVPMPPMLPMPPMPPHLGPRPPFFLGRPAFPIPRPPSPFQPPILPHEAHLRRILARSEPRPPLGPPPRPVLAPPPLGPPPRPVLTPPPRPVLKPPSRPVLKPPARPVLKSPTKPAHGPPSKPVLRAPSGPSPKPFLRPPTSGQSIGEQFPVIPPPPRSAAASPPRPLRPPPLGHKPPPAPPPLSRTRPLTAPMRPIGGQDAIAAGLAAAGQASAAQFQAFLDGYTSSDKRHENGDYDDFAPVTRKRGMRLTGPTGAAGIARGRGTSNGMAKRGRGYGDRY